MKMYKGLVFADVYESILNDVFYDPEYTIAPRGQTIRELTDVALEFNPQYPLYENKVRSSKFKYIAGELIWYFNGCNDIEFISNFSNFWSHLDNGDGTVNSAYGDLLFNKKNKECLNQWQWAVESLKEDKDSRQALIHFNLPEHQYKGNKDFVCTISGLFQIRNNRLNFIINMRSNDLILGLPTDVAFFCLLQQQMVKHLKEYYPKLKLGKYTHVINSAHIYEKNFSLVKKMILSTNENGISFSPLSFDIILENLINEDGTPTQDMIQLKHDVILSENDYSKTFTDPLYKWISTNSNL